MTIQELTDQRLVFLDGAMGTMLQKKGLPPGYCPELWNIEKIENIISVHLEYIAAGADIINTNTFGGNRIKLKEYHIEDQIVKINQKGIEAALRAREKAKKDVFISASIGPTGEFIQPMGKLTLEQMASIYEEQIKILVDAGADILNFETMIDIQELRIAVLVAKSLTHLPIIANLTFTENGRTLTGSDPLSAFNILQGIDVDFVGTNCGMGPADMAQLLKGINRFIHKKIVIQANAGIPKMIDGKTVFTCSVHNYVQEVEAAIQEGVNIVGGCCGTTPEFIQALRSRFENSPFKKIKTPEKVEICLSSPIQTVVISREGPFCKIGEKINPSALKKIADAIRKKDVSAIIETAKAQEQAGASVLDVNFGLADSNEKESFRLFIPELASAVKTPLCIDTTDSLALENALFLYGGRALINSISGEEEKMEKILPLMKKYGSYAIFLPLDERGIPETVEERMQIIEKLLKKAQVYGLGKDRFLVDALVMTISAAPHLAKVSLQTIQEAYQRYGLLSTCGLSNVSFGLPGRNAINTSFLSMLMGYGLDSAILNPQDELITIFIDACQVLTERDKNASIFVEKYKTVKNFFQSQKENLSSPVSLSNTLSFKKAGNTIEEEIYNAVLEGEKNKIVPHLEKAITHFSAQKILNDYMIPAITAVGELYDKRIYFLPQLLLSAETMKIGLSYLEPFLRKETASYKAILVAATVKGDIHDIGKNIVCIMLENHGFKVIDLGKDVPKETILQKAIENQANIILLSALMTTTMVEMEYFMQYMKEKGYNIPVMVGGAVVNQEYANKIGAFYSKDAVGAVELANQIISSKK